MYIVTPQGPLMGLGSFERVHCIRMLKGFDRVFYTHVVRGPEV